MKWFYFLSFLLSMNIMAQPQVESFVIQIKDRKIQVLSPSTRRDIFPVIIENHSLSDHVGKFMVQGKLLKYVTIKNGKTETVEIENKTKANVVFVPVSPAFQEVELVFGKKAYEIPSQQ